MAYKNYGELRRQLAAEGLKWTVNPALSDDAPVRRPSLGADPAKFTLARNVAAVDVAALVRATPPSNTLLLNELVERGVLPRSAITRGGSLQLASTAIKVPATDLTATAVGRKTIATAPPAVPAGGGAGSAPASVDWRNRWTWNFITGIRDQDPCEHCWVYAGTALVEAQVRVEHCVWCGRSEGDYIEANNVPCGQCGNVGEVLDWYASNGVCDQSCVSWIDADPQPGGRTTLYWVPPPTSCGTGSMAAPPAYNPPSNRNGKTVKIPNYTSLGSVADEKNWLANIGPLVCGFEVYDDFFGWSGDSPYIKSANASDDGSHIMLVIGYDDSKQCWIVKNSWGTGWGNAGFGLIGYGQCNIDVWSKQGLQNTNPDPWTKRRQHSGGMIESGDGALHRNFELVAANANHSFSHWWRDNSGSQAWAKAETMASDVATDPTFTGTTYDRNFEAIYITTQANLHHWYYDQSSQQWVNGPAFGPTSATGYVGFCESDYGQGNFEVVVALQSGLMQHWWRAGSVWNAGPTFGARVLTAGPSLLESTYGNLELVATLTSGELQHWWRNGATWIAGPTFGAGIQSHACMIQGQFGADTDSGTGNFELCVAMPDGSVEHWWRNNQDGTHPWIFGAKFGSSVSRVVALLQGSFGFNLEMIVLRNDSSLQHYYRDDAGWHAEPIIGTTL